MLTTLYDVLKDESLNDASKKYLIGLFDEVLGLGLFDVSLKEASVSEEFILDKISLRNKAKADKDYTLADSIRDELLSLGIKLIDTKDGTLYEII